MAFKEGLEHAEHCGTLISQLASLDAAAQAKALGELQQLRASGLSWLDWHKGKR
jgi:hypothetical protein